LFETVLDGSSVYIQNAQTKGAFNPICSFSISGANTVGNNVFINDTGSNDNHTWIYSSKAHQQVPSKYSEPMFSGMNTLPIDGVDINWGDGNTTLNQNPGTSYAHSYTASGDYSITVTLNNVPLNTCTTNYNKRIYWNAPTTTFNTDNTSPNPVGTSNQGELVTFTNTTADVDAQMNGTNPWYWDWEIYDSGIYGNFDDLTNTNVQESIQPTNQWRNPGTHNITLKTHYWDGFNWQISTATQQINQQVWSVANNLTWTGKVYQNISNTYTPGITGNTEYIISTDYAIDTVDTFIGLLYNASFDYTFAVSQQHVITQTINYHDGFGIQNQSLDFNVVMSSLASWTQADSECGGYIFTSTSVAGTPPLTYENWKVTDNNTSEVIATYSGSIFNYAWYKTGNYLVELTVGDSGTPVDQDIHPQVFDILTCPSGVNTSPTQVVVSGGGGDYARSPNTILVGPQVKIGYITLDTEDEDDEEVTLVSKQVLVTEY